MFLKIKNIFNSFKIKKTSIKPPKKQENLSFSIDNTDSCNLQYFIKLNYKLLFENNKMDILINMKKPNNFYDIIEFKSKDQQRFYAKTDNFTIYENILLDNFKEFKHLNSLKELIDINFALLIKYNKYLIRTPDLFGSYWPNNLFDQLSRLIDNLRDILRYITDDEYYKTLNKIHFDYRYKYNRLYAEFCYW